MKRTVFLMVLVMAGLNSGSCSGIELIPQSREVAVFANQSYFVSCRAKNSDSITWIGPGGEVIQDKYSGRIHIEDTRDAEGLDLIFESIRKKDGGQYVCIATVQGEEHRASFNLSVFKAITFSNTPDVQYAPEGADFLIRCNVGGHPEPSVSWKSPNRNIMRLTSKYNSTANGLLVKNASLEDGGKYMCIAVQYHALFTDYKEMMITLKIQHEPRWVPNHQLEAHGFVGGIVNLTCSATAEPGAVFQWIHDNKTIASDGLDGVKIYNSEHQSVLQLRIDDETVFGDYECKATNSFGTMARVIVLGKASKPPPPTFRIKTPRPDSMVLEITASEVQADQGPDGSGVNLETLGYKVQFKLPNQRWEEAKEMNLDKHAPYIIVGMERDTAYEVRVAARTAAGTGEFSDKREARTLKMAATAAPIMKANDSHRHQWNGLFVVAIAALLSAHFCF